MAEISAERDAIEKARLTLLEEHQKLKAESVPHPSLFTLQKRFLTNSG